MRVLVIGGGGREHALCWKLAASPKVERVFCVPGNGGIAQIAQCVDIQPDDFDGLIRLVGEKHIDLTVVGPDNALADGIVDRFEAEQLAIFGPRQNAAILEWSKAFSKEFMARHGIPTAACRVFDRFSEALEYVKSCPLPAVIKADGLALGKGVVVALTHSEAVQAVKQMMEAKLFGPAGDRLVIEEYLEGQEVSLLAFTDGDHVIPMLPAQDHKRLLDGNKGPNTGGMGTIAPVPVMTQEMIDEAMERILLPAVRGMDEEGRSYRGVLYAGLMLTEDGLKVLEFNSRFGDPETQVILPMLKTDLVDIIQAVIGGYLKDIKVEWHEGAAACVVVASGGYPGSYPKGLPIAGLQEVTKRQDVAVFHAGTATRDDHLVTAGGRVLGITARGKTLAEALDVAYASVQQVVFEGMHYRTDIGRTS